MFKRIVLIIITAIFFATVQADVVNPIISLSSHVKVLAKHDMPLTDRYAVQSVNDVFKDNILLTISYLFGKTKNQSDVKWDEVRHEFSYDLVLKPGEVFAYHDNILPEFAGKKLITTNAHFDSSEGFESDGYLVADGVCHLASLLNWVARDAGLKVIAPTNHDFAHIPDIPKEYGTAIYYMPGEDATNQLQNLYIENTHSKPVHFLFQYKHSVLTVSATE